MQVSDYVRLPKSVDPVKHAARWYWNPETGQQISRWQMQIIQAGGINPAERAAIRKAQGITSPKQEKIKRYNDLAKAFKVHQAKKLGVKPEKIRVRGKSATALLFKSEAKSFKDLTKADLLDKSPTGKLARLLTRLGLREREWDMPVGQSPTT